MPTPHYENNSQDLNTPHFKELLSYLKSSVSEDGLAAETDLTIKVFPVELAIGKIGS